LNSDERLRHVADLLPAGFDPHQAMSVLADYVRNLEEAYEDLKKDYAAERRQLETEYRALLKAKDDQKQELDRLTADLMDFTNSYEEQEVHLAAVTQKLHSYEKQFKKIQRDGSEVMNKLTQKENDANFYRQELARSVQDNENLTKNLQTATIKLEESEKRLAVEREAAVMHEKEARRLNLILAESQGKIALTERKLEEAVVKYSDEIRRLTERSGADVSHEVEVFKKRVRAGVTPEILEIIELMRERNSVGTAAAFKVAVGHLFEKLNSIGLNLVAAATRKPTAKKRIMPQ
ncbi:hypothetical protein LJB99_04170, partial [Deltaproteobacteria bacterium OttesenSCG-928-K17]|nr:hypothetical protein [Deltaproteobacteria bacterium OttesenSCG-928-K17]